MTGFCSGNGVVFIVKIVSGAFQIISRPDTQAHGADMKLTGTNTVSTTMFFGSTSGSGFYQRFVND